MKLVVAVVNYIEQYVCVVLTFHFLILFLSYTTSYCIRMYN